MYFELQLTIMCGFEIVELLRRPRRPDRTRLCGIKSDVDTPVHCDVIAQSYANNPFLIDSQWREIYFIVVNPLPVP